MAISKFLILAALVTAASAPSPSKAQVGFTPPEGCDSSVTVEPGRLIQCRCLPVSLKQHPIEDVPYSLHVSQRTSGLIFPVYPARAKAKKLKGTVQLSLGVNDSGRIIDVMLIKGPETFRKVSVDAACSSWLTPRQLRDYKRRIEEGRLDWTITFVPQ